MNIKLLNLGFVREPKGTYLHLEAGIRVEVSGKDRYNVLNIYDGTVTSNVEYLYVENVVFSGMETTYDERWVL